jgi:hypothetical protein
MAHLRLVRDPERELTAAIEELVDQLREVFRRDPTDCAWSLWVHEAPQGFAVRLQRTPAATQRQPTSLAQRRGRRCNFSYSAGGSADFIVADVTDRLEAEATHEAEPESPAGRRRRNDESPVRAVGSKAPR